LVEHEQRNTCIQQQLQVGNGWENHTGIMGEGKWLKIICNKLQNVNRIKYYWCIYSVIVPVILVAAVIYAYFLSLLSFVFLMGCYIMFT